jgi:hypothetical protein
MRRAASRIEHYRKFWEGSLDNLTRYLASISVTETKPVKKNKKGKKP